MHDSRINLAGIMPHNVEYVAKAVAEERGDQLPGAPSYPKA
jgi:hypothetical protein